MPAFTACGNRVAAPAFGRRCRDSGTGVVGRVDGGRSVVRSVPTLRAVGPHRRPFRVPVSPRATEATRPSVRFSAVPPRTGRKNTDQSVPSLPLLPIPWPCQRRRAPGTPPRRGSTAWVPADAGRDQVGWRKVRKFPKALFQSSQPIDSNTARPRKVRSRRDPSNDAVFRGNAHPCSRASGEAVTTPPIDTESIRSRAARFAAPASTVACRYATFSETPGAKRQTERATGRTDYAMRLLGGWA